MDFAQLYHFANGLDGEFVPAEELRSEVKAKHTVVNDVVFWACQLDKAISRGHMILYLDRSSPYEDAFIQASVRFDGTLDNAWARFVCAKELMHIFDSILEKTNNKEKFLQLMDELENNPISVEQSEMFTSERNAEWMALIVLCPLRLRTKAVEYRAKGEDETQIANRLRIPAQYVKAILGNNYLPALEYLIGEPAVALKVVENKN